MCSALPNHFSHVQLFATLWIVGHQAPLSMGFSRQEYWSGLPWPPPGNLPDPGIQPSSLMSPALAEGFFTTSTTWDNLLQGQSQLIKDLNCMWKSLYLCHVILSWEQYFIRSTHFVYTQGKMSIQNIYTMWQESWELYRILGYYGLSPCPLKMHILHKCKIFPPSIKIPGSYSLTYLAQNPKSCHLSLNLIIFNPKSKIKAKYH